MEKEKTNLSKKDSSKNEKTNLNKNDSAQNEDENIDQEIKEKKKEKSKESKKKAGMVVGIVGLSVAAAIAAAVGANAYSKGGTSCTITYLQGLKGDDVENFQGGSFNVREGTTIGDLKRQLAPVDGYEVEGFYRDPDCTVGFDDNDRVMGDTRIYIKFQEIKATVKFYSSKDLIPDSKVGKQVQIGYFDKLSESDLLEVEQVKESDGIRYNFKGWQTVLQDENGHFLTVKELVGKSGKELIELDADGDRELELFAVYESESIDYNINFDNAFVSIERNGEKLSSGDVIHFGDKLEITLSASVGHAPSSLKINGVEKLSEFKNNKLTFTADGNVSISYAEELLEFTVTYYREDGEKITEETVKYDEAATYSKRPSKDSDETYNYEFLKWIDKTSGEDVDLEHIKGDVELKPEFEATYIEYDISEIPSGVTITRFRENDGKNGKQLSASDKLHYGDQIKVEYALTNGHKVKVFEVQGATVQDDGKYSVTGMLTVIFEEEYITYSIGEYEGVKVYRGESVGDDNLLVMGEKVNWGEKVTIVYVLKEGYKFKSLSINGKADYTEEDKQVTIEVKSDLVIEFESEIMTFDVVYYSEDGESELFRETVNYDDAAKYDVTPSKEPDSTYTYKFSKWVDKDTGAEVDLKNVKKDMNVKASFDEIFIEYSLTFDDDVIDVKKDGQILTPSDKLHFGDTIVVEFSDREGYTRTLQVSGAKGEEFASGSSFTVSGNVSIEITDKANEFKLGTIPDGVTVTVQRENDSVQLESGDSIFYDEVLTITYKLKEHYHLTKFTIAGENRDTENNVSHIVRSAFEIEFEQAIDTYTVEFFDEYKEDGSAKKLDSVQVNWNEKAEFADPSKESDKIYDYEFLYWADESGEQVDLSHITEDKTVYAKYSSTFIEYNVTVEPSKNVTIKVYLVGEQETLLDAGKTVHFGDVLKITYEVHEGFLLSVFTINGVDVEGHENNHQFSVEGHTTIRIDASEQKVSVSEFEIPDGVTLKKADGSPLGEGDEITWGDEIIVSYELEDGKQVDKFIVNGQDCSENDYRFEFKGRIDVTFEQSYIKYSVTFYDDDGEKVLGTIQVEWGQNAEFDDPQEKRDETYIYTFSKWVTEKGGEQEANLREIKSELSVYASYSKKYIEYEVTFDESKLTITKNGEEFALGETTHYGDKLVVTAIEREGYNRSFSVKGADSEGDGYTVKGNVQIEVTDTAKEYHLQALPDGVTVTVSRNGEDVQVSSNESIFYDEVITVTFEEKVGFTRSISVSGVTGEGTASNSKFTVTGDVTITLNEEQIEYKLTIINEIDGTITIYNQTQNKAVENGENVHYGDKLKITYSASVGHTMSKFEVNGATQDGGEGDIYTVTGTITITYEEELKTYRFDDSEFTIPSGVTVSKDGKPLSSGDTLTWGDQITVTYTESNESMEKDVFTVNGEERENGYSFKFEGELEVQYTEKIKKFTVTYYDETGTQIIHTEEVEWGNDATYNVKPTKNQDVEYTYEFDNWYTAKAGEEGQVATLTGIKAETTVYARFTETKRAYELTIPTEHFTVERDGEPLSSDDPIYYNDSLTITVTPSNGYDFKSFKINETLYEQTSVTITAQGNVVISDYTETIKKFTVTFYDENGENPETEEVEWGKGITHENPSKEADVRYTYEFAGWYSDKDGGHVVNLSSVKESVSVYARFNNIDVKYYIRFSEDIAERISVTKNGENLNNGDYVLYDEEISVSYTLSDGHELVHFKVNGSEVENGYTFKVHEQVSIEFEETIITFSIEQVSGITLYRGNSTEERDKLNAGDIINWGEEITIVYNLSEGYEFDSLTVNGQSYSSEDTKIVIIIKDELEIEFKQKLKQFTVEFFDEDGASLGFEVVTWNKGITKSNPTKSDKTYTYTFENWYSSQEGGEVVDLTHVTENLKVYARYHKEFIEYIVNFYDYDGDLLFSDSVHYLETAEPEEIPTRDMDNYNSFTFDKWVTSMGGDEQADLTNISESKDVFASYTATPREYTVTFDENVRVKKGEQVLESGATLHYDDEFTVEFDDRAGYTRTITVTGVVGSGTGSGSTFTVAGNVEIKLNEVLIEYNVKLDNSSDGEVEIYNETQGCEVVAGETTVHYGDRLRITYSVSEGHTLQEFKVSGADRENESDIYVVSDNVVVTYTEILSEYDFDRLQIPSGVTVKNQSGKILGSGDKITWGEEITVTYQCATGKEKKSFKVNDEERDNNYKFQFEGRLDIEFVEDWIEYTVTFYNGDDIFETVKVKYGQTAATTLGNPTKQADETYRYEFAHWASTRGGSDEANLGNITNDKSFYAYYNSIYIEYSVTFDESKLTITKNGEEFAHGNTVHYGDKLVVTAIEREGYNRTFSVKGADSEEGGYTVKGNVQIEVTDTAKEYHLQTLPDGVTVTVSRNGEDVQVSSSESIFYDEVITVTFEEKVGFTRSISVSGVTGEGTASNSKFTVTGDVTITLNEKYIEYELTVNNDSEGTITIYNETQECAVENGGNVHYGDKLTITYSASVGHTMSRFEVEGATQDGGVGDVYTVSGAVTINYEEELKTYRFDDSEFTIPSGVTVSKGGQVLKSGDTLTWGDTIKVTYTESEGKHKQTFTVNGTSRNNDFTFQFQGTLEVVYDEAINTYNVNYYDESGTQIIHTEEVEWGNDATYNVNPIKNQDVEFTYVFDNWYTAKAGEDGQVATLTGIKAETNVYARFTANRREYEITIPTDHFTVQRDGEPLSSGAIIYYNDSLTITATPSDGYDFKSFKINGTLYEQASVTFTAQGNVTISDYAETIKKFTVTFYDESGENPETEEVEWGKGITHTNPTKQDDKKFTYTFVQWVDKENGKPVDLTAVKENLEVKPEFRADYIEYGLTFNSKYLSVKKEGQSLNSGDTVHYDDELTISGNDEWIVSALNVSGANSLGGEVYGVTGEVNAEPTAVEHRYLKLELKDGSYNVVGLKENMNPTRIIIPDENFDGTSISSIGDNAFSGNTTVTSLDLGKNITNIGVGAFYGCTNLTELNWYAVHVEDFAEKSNVFYDAGSSGSGIALTFGEDVQNIPAYCFVGQNPDSQSENHSAKLQSVKIGSKVERIGGMAFDGCLGYEEVNYTGTIDKWASITFEDEGSNPLVKTAAMKSSVDPYEDVTALSIDFGRLLLINGSAQGNIKINASIIMPIAFAGCSSLKTVTFGENVTEIGDEAFAYCHNISDVTISDNISTIGLVAFGVCVNLKSITIPENVIGIGEMAFAFCSGLTEINWNARNLESDESYGLFLGAGIAGDGINLTFGESVKTIPAGCFCGEESEGEFIFGPKIKNMIIGSNVTDIGAGAFLGCTGYDEVNYTGTINSWASINFADPTSSPLVDYFFINSIMDGEQIEGGRKLIINGVEQVDVTISVPVNMGAFVSCSSIKSIIFDENVTNIGDYAFFCCTNLGSVTLGQNVNEIESQAFFGCINLKMVMNKSGLQVVAGHDDNGYVAYYATAVIDGETETIGDIIYQIKGGQYEAIDLVDRTKSTYTLSEKTTKISDRLFYNCTNLTSITIPENVSIIGSEAFYGCVNLKTLNWNAISVEDFANISEDINSILNVFYDAGTGGDGIVLTFGESVQKIPAFCFVGLDKSDVSSMESIHSAKLKKVTIGSNVTEIGIGAFAFCSGYDEVNYTGTIDGWASINFVDITGNPLIDYLSLYSSGDESNVGRKLIINGNIQDNVKINVSVNSYAFAACSSLTNIEFGEGVINIAESAFEGCMNLTSVTLGENINNIESQAFWYCENLTRVVNKSGLQVVIGDKGNGYVAYYASVVIDGEEKIIDGIIYSIKGGDYIAIGLQDRDRETYTLSEKTTKIGESLFANCTNLTNIIIPVSVLSIGNDAFLNCNGLTEIGYSGLIEQWASINFANENSNPLRYAGKFKIGDQLQENIIIDAPISQYAFYGYIGLKSITLNSGVTSIGTGAFQDCTKLVEVDYNGTIDQWVSINFVNGYSNPLCYAGQFKLGDQLQENITIDAPISQYAFYSYSGLKSITLNNGVTSIGDRAFYNCLNLTNINWNATSVKNFSTNSNIFYNAGTSGDGVIVIFGDTVSTIPAYCFYVSSTSYSPKITNVTLGKGVNTIGNQAFYNCLNITNINWNATSVTNFSKNSNVFYNAGTSGDGVTVIFGDTVSTIPAYCFYVSNTSYSPKISNVTLGRSVTSIGTGAFQGCTELDDVNYSGTIDQWVGINFVDGYSNPLCYAGKFKIGDQLQESIIIDAPISQYAFYGYNGLKSITLNSGVISIGNQAFYNCLNLTNINWNATSVKNFSTNSNIFYNAGTSGDGVIVIFGDTVSTIPAYCFYVSSTSYSPKITNVTLGKGVNTIGNQAFYNCLNITNINWNATSAMNFSTNSNVFYNVGTSGDGVTVIFGDTVSTIPAYCFYVSSTSYSPKITNVTLGKGVSSIGNQAFYNCFNITNINWNATSVTDFASDSNIFNNVGTSGDGVTVIFGDTVSTIPAHCFYENTLYSPKITNVAFGRSVASIGSWAFRGCTELVEVDYNGTIDQWVGINFVDGYSNPLCYAGKFKIGDQLQESIIISAPISQYAFYGYSGLKSITLNSGVTSIGNQAFYNCLNITNINWNATSVADFATESNVFYRVGTSGDGVTVIFSDTVSTIPAYCFYVSSTSYSPKITNVTLGKGVNTIGNQAFYNCLSITNINWNATSVADFATESNVFYRVGTSGNGVTVIFGDTVSTIPAYCFYVKDSLLSSYHPKITNVTIGKNVSGIGDHAFENCTNLTSINWNAISVADFTSSSNVFCKAGKNSSGITVIFGDSVQKIPAYCFYVNSILIANQSIIRCVTISNSVSSIGTNAFDSQRLWKVINKSQLPITAGSSDYGNVARYASVVFKSEEDFESRTETYNDVVYCNHDGEYEAIGLLNIGLSSYTLSDKTTKIANYLFYNCSLNSITIPSSVKTIGSCAFHSSNLQNVYYKGNKAAWSAISINSNNDPLTKATIYYYEAANPYASGSSLDQNDNYWHYEGSDTTTPVVWPKETT